MIFARCLVSAAVLVFLSSCSSTGEGVRADFPDNQKVESDIVSYECQSDDDKARGYAPTVFIFSLKTGKNYGYDFFSERLVVEEGFVGNGFGDEDVRIRNHIRSALVGDTWKWRHELGRHVIVESRINLKTLEYRRLTTNAYQSTNSTGKCVKIPVGIIVESVKQAG